MKFKEILNEERFQFTVDGYGYHEEEEIEVDRNNSKLWHYMTTPQGERITLDHSPYQYMEKEEFAVYVAKHKASTRELTEIVENSSGDSEVYVAAKLYLSHPGLVKTALAKELSQQTGLDYKVAVLLIDAIDAYEDIREAPEVWEV